MGEGDTFLRTRNPLGEEDPWTPAWAPPQRPQQHTEKRGPQRGTVLSQKPAGNAWLTGGDVGGGRAVGKGRGMGVLTVGA